jgi:hypothetical protein
MAEGIVGYRGSGSEDVEELKRWMEDMLKDMLGLKPDAGGYRVPIITNPPRQERKSGEIVEGLLVIASGVFPNGKGWDPGQGRGLYIYLGGAWKLVLGSAAFTTLTGADDGPKHWGVLTEVQRDALSPRLGDMVFNSTKGRYEAYNGTQWDKI